MPKADAESGHSSIGLIGSLWRLAFMVHDEAKPQTVFSVCNDRTGVYPARPLLDTLLSPVLCRKPG
jgi:hypothetical protein